MKGIPTVGIDAKGDGTADVTLGIRHAPLVRTIADDAVRRIVLLDRDVVHRYPESKDHELEKSERQEQGRERYPQEIPKCSHPEVRLSERSPAGKATE